MKRREIIKWSMPLVASASLPAHAQTSICNSDASVSVEILSVSPSSGTLNPGDIVEFDVRYEATNVPAGNTITLFNRFFYNEVSFGRSQILDVTDTSGTVTVQIEYLATVDQFNSGDTYTTNTITSAASFTNSCDSTTSASDDFAVNLSFEV